MVYTAQVYAWGPLGHQLVGDVAERHITDKTREALKELLSDGRTLGDVANWADSIKGERPETRPWHYANVEEGAKAFELERDCGEQSCVVEQVIFDLEVLRDPEATHAAKVEALFFLVHFVGDVHQPLHIGRASDRGGNDIQVTFERKKTNLHSLWDTGLLVHTGLDRDEYLASLNRMVKPNKVREWTETLDPVDWATESHILAHSNAYIVPKNGRVGETYYRRNITVVNTRLAMASVRLAKVLNDIYDPPSSVIIPPEEGVKEIVYVIGNPDGNKHVDAYRYREMSQAIEGLSEDQNFTVIVYQLNGMLEPPPRGTMGKAATEKVKERVIRWLDPQAKNYKGVSKPDPIGALKQAMLYKPDLIYWWLGQSKGLAPNDEALTSLLDEIDRLNMSGAAINTIERLPYPYLTGGKTPTVAEIIAEHTGGQHRFYNNSDIVGK